VPGVEHITILFSPTAHRTAVGWLEQTFGPQQASDYQDMRMVWYLVQLVAWLLLAAAVTPVVRVNSNQYSVNSNQLARGRKGWVVGLLLGPWLATAVLAGLNRLFPVGEVGGILIAGALGMWFLVMGLTWLGLAWFFNGDWEIGRLNLLISQSPNLSISNLLYGLAIFAFLWLAFGLMAQVVWLPWLLIPVRLVRWPLLAMACFPWLLAAGLAQHRASTGWRLAWWLGQSVVIVMGLVAAVFLIPSLFFLILVVPLLPIVIGIMALVGGAVDDPWAYGLGNALFFAWLLLAMFPLVG
jgi:hypothetical protein